MSGVSNRKFLYFKLYINNLSKYNFNLGNTTANNHKNIDRIATFSGGTWVSKDYNADFGGQWCLVDSFLINDNGAMQRIMSTQTNTVLATRYCEKNVWGDWDIGVTKSDLNKNGAQIGSLLKVYHGESSDKQNKVTLTTSATHMCGFLIIDQNNQTDVYVIGVNSGVTTLCKTSAENTPVISKNSSGCTLEIPLKTWSSFVFLSFYSCNISTTLM